MGKRTKQYENMSLEELKEVAQPPEFMDEFMNNVLYNNPRQHYDGYFNDGLRIYNNSFTNNMLIDVFIVHNHHIIGILVIDNHNIQAIAIHPQYRRMGIAKRLIGEAINLGATRFYGTISPDIVKYVWWFYHERWRF